MPLAGQGFNASTHTLQTNQHSVGDVVSITLTALTFSELLYLLPNVVWGDLGDKVNYLLIFYFILQFCLCEIKSTSTWTSMCYHNTTAAPQTQLSSSPLSLGIREQHVYPCSQVPVKHRHRQTSAIQMCHEQVISINSWFYLFQRSITLQVPLDSHISLPTLRPCSPYPMGLVV